MQIRYFVSPEERAFDPSTPVESAAAVLDESGYVALVSDGHFLGIVTAADVVLAHRSRCGDCLRPRPFLSPSQDIESVAAFMEKERQDVLPVVSDDGRYLGCAVLSRLLRELVSLKRPSPPVLVMNVSGNGELESAKRSFIAELSHHTKNPIQTVFSALDLMDSAGAAGERELLLDAARVGLKRLNAVIDALVSAYFPDRGARFDNSRRRS